MFAGLGIILGAFGAHALKPLLTPEQLVTFETAVRYQMYHAFGLLFSGLLHHLVPSRLLRTAAVFFIIGIFLFSGSLYAITLLKMQGEVGLGGVGIITPIGGLFFILGWIFLVLASLSRRLS